MDDRWNAMLELVVHPRVSARHPQLSDEDVRVAWQNSFFQALRTGSKNSPEYLWIGIDGKGREIEMVGVPTATGYLIYHANTPLSKRVRDEVKGRRT